ncbi:uncharacterized protein LAESUDRAFT_116346 [Laetiporus sulphureus 93-53]|uniref:Uncharacterized protein n=1 Tax=Laetiporus sulphureus 93-53 TaxID=1314785 RepID=A0A165AT53_9APHY|nr:uncharacterized protein LAESUDRAFT_116346 [Laetiporus sulphureus 93-53]KZS99609.1 hypothetical protein LAESUDRAFT_116346 [Laetiporus sulphureus 93-53]
MHATGPAHPTPAHASASTSSRVRRTPSPRCQCSLTPSAMQVQMSDGTPCTSGTDSPRGERAGIKGQTSRAMQASQPHLHSLLPPALPSLSLAISALSERASRPMGTLAHGECASISLYTDTCISQGCIERQAQVSPRRARCQLHLCPPGF